MKIAYFINSIFNAGGTERVLVNKINYFSKKEGYEVFVVTTDQNKRLPFYDFPNNIKHIDLGINYFENSNQNLFLRKIKKIKKIKKHKKEIEKFLKKEKIDIAVSIGSEEKSFLYKIKDGSKKIKEIHFTKEFKIIRAKIENRNIFECLKSKIDTFKEDKQSKKYDKFIVLTHEDKTKWNNENIDVIYNSVSFISKKFGNLESKKAIAVGRLSKEKGFDILIEAWKKVAEKFPGWKLEIYGEGKERKNLQKILDNLDLNEGIKLMGATKEIEEKYLNSSLCIMPSRCEGFGMILVEAMSCGLPLVSFNCPSGPSEIIEDGFNGYLAKNGDIEDLADKIMKAIEDEEHLKDLGANSKKSVEKFSEEIIMRQWENLFNDLLDK